MSDAAVPATVRYAMLDSAPAVVCAAGAVCTMTIWFDSAVTVLGAIPFGYSRSSVELV